MCTVTVVPLAEGFRLACNRDERRDRPPALSPRVYLTARRRWLCPVDPLGGGTWIGVNDAGLAMVLLNRNPARTVPSNRSTLTRGAIIPMFLGHAWVDAALQEATAIDANLFAPFQLVIVRDATVGVLTWNGRQISAACSPFIQPILYTSSTLGDARVDGPRRRLFERLVVGDSGSHLRGQATFHRHQWRHSPQTSVVMSRADALTVSRTVIDVTVHEVRLTYEDLSAMRP
jgi:transport and Golgi organization protein 2